MQIYDGREQFYQWDVNQKITSSTFKVGDEIHFFNIKQATALVVVAYELAGKVVADVPNILLQSSHPVIVYHCITVGDTSNTVAKVEFKVDQRAKPDDYVYTETEVKSYESLEQRIQRLEDSGGTVGDISYTVLQNKPKINGVELVGDITSAELGIKDGVDGKDGKDGKDGINGKDGKDGKDGYTPIKGVDYYTQEDKDEINELISDETTIQVNEKLGDIETAIDEIIALQNSILAEGVSE